MEPYREPLEKLKRLVSLLMERFDAFRQIAEENTNRKDAAEHLVWVLQEQSLNLTYKQGKMLLPGDLPARGTEDSWREEMDAFRPNNYFKSIKRETYLVCYAIFFNSPNYTNFKY